MVLAVMRASELVEIDIHRLMICGFGANET